MKIALCYSGLASRFIDSDISNLLTQFEAMRAASLVDIYISAWDDGVNINVVHDFFITAIFQSTNVKFGDLRIELNEQPVYKLKYDDRHTWSKDNKAVAIYAMFKGIQNSDQMRVGNENNDKYDLVIRSRPDIRLQGVIDLHLWDRIVTNESLAIFPKTYNFFHFWNSKGGMLCDQFFAAKPEIMEKIVTIPDEIDNMCDAGCRFHPESLLWWKMRYGIGLPPLFSNPVNPWYSFQDFFIHLRGKVFF